MVKRTYPFTPFPNGWFQVAFSDELAPGAVLPLHYFGRELVLFRTESGLAQVLDPYCPHLGAHLGHGGRVAGESLRCPFHGWCFGGDGKCTDIPYSPKIPSRAEVRSWPVEEVNGTIMVWHHGDGAAPEYSVPRASQLDDPAWRTLGRFRWHYPTHLQEMADNAADPPHLVHLHGVESATGELEDLGHDLRIITRFLSDPKRIGIPAEPVQAQIDSLLHGLGLQIIVFDAVVQGLVFLTFTPVDGEMIDARMVVGMKRLGDEESEKVIGALIVKDVVRQFEEDIVIWSHKVYNVRPVLVEGDGAIGRLRRWSRQFYPASDQRESEARAHAPAALHLQPVD